MIARLFPQLPLAIAQDLANGHATALVENLRAAAASSHPAQIFSATGGQQMTRSELEEFAATIRESCAAASPSTVDPSLTRALHPRMPVTRHEAALDGVWSFLACVLVPDVVRWRFAGESTPADRFLGSGRGVRNVLGRAWWRGELLWDATPPPGKDHYWLVDELGEDELTGLVERQRAIASRRVAVALAKTLTGIDCKGVPRSKVARDAFKIYLRLGYFVEFDSLEDHELEVACQSLYVRSVMALRQRTGEQSD